MTISEIQSAYPYTGAKLAQWATARAMSEKAFYFDTSELLAFLDEQGYQIGITPDFPQDGYFLTIVIMRREMIAEKRAGSRAEAERKAIPDALNLIEYALTRENQRISEAAMAAAWESLKKRIEEIDNI